MIMERFFVVDDRLWRKKVVPGRLIWNLERFFVVDDRLWRKKVVPRRLILELGTIY